MILDCNGNWNEEAKDFVQAWDCIDGKVVKGYSEIENDPDIVEFDPGRRCTDGKIHVPIICCFCAEEDTEDHDKPAL